MSFSIQKDFPSQDIINSYIKTYSTINTIYAPVLKSDNFVVDSNNCFICSSVSGKLYIVLPGGSKGRIIIFVNQTENELISVDSLTTLNPVYNVVSASLSPSILNSYAQYFSILVSDGSNWYKMN